MEKESERITHESFGQIYFGRTNGHASFYGSELAQDHYITMEVYHSELERTLTQDSYYNKKTYYSKIKNVVWTIFRINNLFK